MGEQRCMQDIYFKVQISENNNIWNQFFILRYLQKPGRRSSCTITIVFA